MKKVFDGLLYDTSTAEEVGAWGNGLYGNDFNRCEETLYRTPNGRYFLHGEGGAASKYQRVCGQNSWTGGEEIIPMTPEEAQEWAEQHLDGDTVAAEFTAVQPA
ncbi:MAG: hypothetical protein JXA20_05540 [Spirochaetes bacterium]|nr:hypothetical protein [Spirochaetota bacterium]